MQHLVSVHKSDLTNFIWLIFLCLLACLRFRMGVEFCPLVNFWLHKGGMELSLMWCASLHHFLNEL